MRTPSMTEQPRRHDVNYSEEMRASWRAGTGFITAMIITSAWYSGHADKIAKCSGLANVNRQKRAARHCVIRRGFIVLH